MVRQFDTLMIQEEIVNFGKDGSMCGIYSPPQVTVGNDNLCIIFLNAGLIHKIGPNRIYKKLSDTYSGIGFASFRMDFSGLGDSGSSHGKVNNANGQVAEVKWAMNWLQENKGIDKFLLTGICSGAKTAWDTALEDQRIVGLCLIDGIFADDRLLKDVGWKAGQNLKARYYKKHIFSVTRWSKLLSGKSKLLTLKNIKIVFKRSGNKHVKSHPDIDISAPCAKEEPWKGLFERNVKTHLIFCEGGNAIDVYNYTLAKQLSIYRKSGVLQSTYIKDVDHTFTPTWSQNYLSDLTMSWLKTEFKNAHQL